MDQSLKPLFERALSGEPLPPPGGMAQAAMASGRRQRRRRHLALGGVAGVVTVLATVVAVNVAIAGPTTTTTTLLATRPECIQEATEIAVFLKDDITDEQRAALHDWLRSDPRVHQARYESKEAALANFREIYRDAPDLLNAVKPGQMRDSFRVTLADGAARSALQEDVQARPGVDTVGGEVELATDIAVFLEDDITDEQRAALDEWLRSDPRVRQVRYESKEVAYAKFREMYRDAPSLLNAVKPGQLPESFQLTLADGAAREALQEDAQARPGVDTVIGEVCAGGRRPGEGE